MHPFQSIANTRATRLFALVVAAILILSGCASVPPPSVSNIGYETDSNYNFDAVATFAIVRPESLSPMSPILRKNLLAESAYRLKQMGYKEVSNTNEADILVSIHGTSKRVIDSITYSDIYYTHTYRRSSWIYMGGYPSTYITTREEGTLLLDIADAKTKELVWRGWGVRRFTLEDKVSNEQIQESVRRLLVNFPPPQRKKPWENADKAE